MDDERTAMDYINTMQRLLTLRAAAVNGKDGSTTPNGNSVSTVNSSNTLEAEKKPYHFGLDQLLASREPTVAPEPSVCASVRSKSNGRHKASRRSPNRCVRKGLTNRGPSMGFPPISPQMNSHYDNKDSGDIGQYSDSSDSNEGVNVHLNVEVSQRSYGSGFPTHPFPNYIPNINSYVRPSSIPVAMPPMTAENMTTKMFQAQFNGCAYSGPQQFVPLKPFEEDVNTEMKNNRKLRVEKKPIPDEQKDQKYYERRQRNNLAAKKSRDSKKSKDDEMARYCEITERKNVQLKAEWLDTKAMCRRLGLDPEVIAKLITLP